MLAPDFNSFEPEQVAQHARAGKRIFQMQFVDPSHQTKIARRNRLGLVIDQRAGQIEQISLPSDW